MGQQPCQVFCSTLFMRWDGNFSMYARAFKFVASLLMLLVQTIRMIVFKEMKHSLFSMLGLFVLKVRSGLRDFFGV